ncbi:endoribonuclease YbeY-like isoform X3 [Corythoichthys intestinalis]|uniref:endoribonuclease YbeY-like isoform X3 n=1 Tax=Corythoichthys intestinalis TaxID=161448 RepID=UPI0025A56381|nr:endoribonuclease YbeY-like isoform X3 [Corythoichthys intestinalis]
MGVVVRNLQKVVPLRRARLRKDVNTLRHILGIQKFDLGVICVDNRRMQHINNIYRKKDEPTDVLSFLFHEGLRPGKMPCPLHRDELNLGDIFLGVEYVMKQCQEESIDLHAALTWRPTVSATCSATDMKQRKNGARCCRKKATF